MDTSVQITPVTTTTYDELQNRLAYLAGLWRRVKSDEVVERYHIVLKTLLELGFREWLDVESELPRDLMPPEYRRLILEARAERKRNA